jgi:hypothetical protein
VPFVSGKKEREKKLWKKLFFPLFSGYEITAATDPLDLVAFWNNICMYMYTMYLGIHCFTYIPT